MDNNKSTGSQGLLFCHKCGARLLSDSVFCSKCGTKVEVSLNRGPAVNQTFSIPSENNEDKPGNNKGLIAVIAILAILFAFSFAMNIKQYSGISIAPPVDSASVVPKRKALGFSINFFK